jgi:hypothetical protein
MQQSLPRRPVKLHANARLTPFQRDLMCRRVRDDGWTVDDAADAAGSDGSLFTSSAP